MKNFIQTKLQALKNFYFNHKKASITILIIVVAIFAYSILTKKPIIPTTYITTVVTKGDVVASTTGTGQMETSSSIDLKAGASTKVVYIGVKPGDVVKKGKLLFSLDATDAEKAVRDAQMNLETAQLSLEKFKNQNSNDIINADLTKAYEDGFNTMSNTFLDIPSITTDLNNLLAEQKLSDNASRISGQTAQDYRDKAVTLFYQAKDSLTISQTDFVKLDRNSSKDAIDKVISETYDTTRSLDDAVVSLKNFVDYLAQDSGRTSDFTSYQTTLSGYASTLNGDISNLLSAEANIKTNKDALQNTGLDTQSNELGVEQKQNSLQDAKDNLANYYVYAPFDGTISSILAQVGQTASGALGTIITKQQVASITLNEVDVSKIQLGQKVTITFDAISDLSLTGTVSQIDSVGTVSQGVVSYTVKINLDTGDVRIKSGMSVSATIITDTAQDVLTVPNSAIKTKNGISVVETFSTPLAQAQAGAQGSPSAVLPTETQVTTGLSDDTNTEIVSGLQEGDIVVTKTIAGSATTTTKTTTPSLLNAVGGNRAGASAGSATRGIQRLD